MNYGIFSQWCVHPAALLDGRRRAVCGGATAPAATLGRRRLTYSVVGRGCFSYAASGGRVWGSSEMRGPKVR